MELSNTELMILNLKLKIGFYFLFACLFIYYYCLSSRHIIVNLSTLKISAVISNSEWVKCYTHLVHCKLIYVQYMYKSYVAKQRDYYNSSKICAINNHGCFILKKDFIH